MPTIIVINGPAGVGKSTICQHLKNVYPEFIHISGDCLRSFAPENAKKLLGPGSTYAAAAALIIAYLDMGAENILFDYIFTSPEQAKTFRNRLPSDDIAQCHFVTLWAPWDTVKMREATRQERERLGSQVKQTYETMQANLAAFGKPLGMVINNTDQPETTAAVILRNIGGKEEDSA